MKACYRAIALLLVVTFILHLHAINVSGQRQDEKQPDNQPSSGYYLSQYADIAPRPAPAAPQKGNRRKQKSEAPEAAKEQPQQPVNKNEVTIESDDQQKDGDVFIATGYVVITYGASKLQADKIIYNSVTGDAEAEGNVIFDPDARQRITAQRATLNIFTRKGTFYEATGFTDQTADGATLNFIAERAEKTGPDSYMLYGVSVTACEQSNPAWSFEADKAKLRIDKSVAIRGSVFRFKSVPIFYLPAVQLPLGRNERKSGFLIPTAGNSTQRGRFFQQPYYQTLGRSADLLIRGDLYSGRGLGVATTFRVRPDENSYLKLGTFSVADRIFGDETTGDGRDDGGTIFFAKGVQHLPHGFLAVVDVDFTTSLNFRRTFGGEIEQVFNPEKRSQLYITNNFSTGGGNYSFNILAESKTDTLFNTRSIFADGQDSNIDINVRHLPSFQFTGFGQQIANLPLYLSFDTTLEGLYRRDRFNEAIRFITPTIVQRLDMSPRLLLTLPDLGGWVVRPELALRSTYYTNSLIPSKRPEIRGALSGENIFRKYLEFALEIRPPSLARTYSYDDGTPRFKHIIEPHFNYRKISGVDNFPEVIRFDARDAIANTNEIEYGVTNRIFVPRFSADGTTSTHELLSVAVTQKYFFDTDFGGALVAGGRNQFFPINTLSGFTFGGRERRFSPLNLNVRYRPLSSLSADMRMDFDTQENKVRNFSIAGQISRRWFTFSERFYYANRLQIAPGLIEPGTFPGSLLVSNFSIGNETRGYYGGGSFSYDFTNRSDVITNLRSRSGLRRSSFYFGYACDCGNLEINLTTLNVGGFRDTRISFSFTLSGIGSLGTERLQQ